MCAESRQLRTSHEGSLARVDAKHQEQLEAPSACDITPFSQTHILTDKPTLLERIVAKDNIYLAAKRVCENKGAAGIDKMSVSELHDYLDAHIDTLRQELMEGRYKPNPVLRVEIPKKEKGKVRLLGIPTVVDRCIQQAITQVLTPVFEPQFSEFSFGFRPHKSAHDALTSAIDIANEGYVWVVDMDLEKFFDTVAHSKLIRTISQTIEEPAVISLIHKYLNAGVMSKGTVEPTRVGVPQGGPLSPLLANIMLNELDKELENRGHRFVRYADDCMIFCKSRKAAERCLVSITRFIEKKLHLKVNREKTCVAYLGQSQPPIKFLGYGFYKSKTWQLRLHPKTLKAMKARIKELTKRNQAASWEELTGRLAAYVRGWVNYYKLANMKALLKDIDSWMRRRVRMLIWKRWKRVRTKYRKLRKLGLDHIAAIQTANMRIAYWRAASTPRVQEALSVSYLESCGLISFLKYYLLVRM